MKCNSCGKEINSVNVMWQDHDGCDRDDEVMILGGSEEECFYLDHLSSNNTFMELSNNGTEFDDDSRGSIFCPLCKEYPFKTKKPEVVESYTVIFREDSQ